MAWGVTKALSRLTIEFALSAIEKGVRLKRIQEDYIPANRRLGVLIVSAFALSGCYSTQGCVPSSCGGPERLIPVNQELQPIQAIYNFPDTLRDYRSASAADKIAIRNEFIFQRIYAMDVSYTAYEESLTKESENEGFLAAAINAGLTGAGALIPVAQTTRLLSQIALGVTALDQAYNKQYLLSKAVQILQSQMRARRADVLTHIIARTKTSIAEYPLGMAMSDLEEYYRAGTLAAAFIDLTQNVGTEANQKKDVKEQIKPGAADVARAVRAAKIADVSVPFSAPIVRREAIELMPAEIGKLRFALCLPTSGGFDDEANVRLNKYFHSRMQPDFNGINPRNRVLIDRLLRLAQNNQTADCALF